jgi:DNA-directed RNA polymerase specialized sigma24 family protein
MNTLDEAERSESWLVLRAQAGDREAPDALFRSIQEPLFRYLQKMVGEPDLARDILQEVLLRVYSKLSWLREPALFRAWSFRIATREVSRHLGRKQARERQLDGGLSSMIWPRHSHPAPIRSSSPVCRRSSTDSRPAAGP